MLITVFVLQLPTVDLKDEADVLHYIFMLVPTYTYVFLCALLSSHFCFCKKTKKKQNKKQNSSFLQQSRLHTSSLPTLPTIVVETLEPFH